MMTDMVIGRATTSTVVTYPDIQELLGRIDPPKKVKMATGCPYCNPNNYEPYWLYDLENVIAEDDMIGLSMVYDDLNNKFSLRASGDGEVTVEINFCPFCGRKLTDKKDDRHPCVPDDYSFEVGV